MLTPLNRCLACGNAELRPFLDLGVQPLANAYHDGSADLPRFPLVVQHCVDCGHCQLTHAVDPEVLYSRYLYVSGTSATLRADMAQMAKQLVGEFRAEHGRAPRVLDIACNDGTLLEAFRAEGAAVYGVEPAANLAQLCWDKHLSVAHTYWPPHIAAADPLRGPFDIITALNVLGHTRDPLAFLNAAADVLSPEGLIVTQTSQEYWLRDGQFDYWYHEHLSGFTRRSLYRLAVRADLDVAMTTVPIHGGSLRATFRPGRYRQAGRAAEATKQALRRAMSHLAVEGYTLCGYGAAAKGMTLLNYAGGSLSFIADDAPAKHGLLTPGLNIPIVAPGALAAPERLAVLLLAWNFADEIMAKVRALREGKETVFVVPFPEVRVC